MNSFPRELQQVMPAPPLAPVRQMVEVPGPPNSFDPRGPKATFKVMSYNTLADIYATPQVRLRAKRSTHQS
jgi:proline-rich tail region repeat protein